MPPAQFSAGFHSLLLVPTSKLGPSGADSQVGAFVYILGPCGSPNKLSCEAGSFSCCLLNPYRCFQSEVLRLYFPCVGTLGCKVCLAPQLFLLVYLHTNVGLLGPPNPTSHTPPAAALPWVLSTPPAGLDECFFCNSLVVGLPYSSIFWQFWLFFLLKLLLSFFWLWEEAQCVSLRLHLAGSLCLFFYVITLFFLRNIFPF